MTTSRDLNIDDIKERFDTWISEQCKEYVDPQNARFQLDAIEQMFVCSKQ